MHGTRTSRLALLGAAAVILASGPALPSAAVQSEPPELIGFSYVGEAFGRVGVTADVARIDMLEAVEEDTMVTVVSSHTDIAVVSDVVVPAGESSANVPLTGVSAGSTTLTASLGTTEIALNPELRVLGADEVPSQVMLTVIPSSVQPGEDALGVIDVDLIAPAGGTMVTLSSDHAAVDVPATATVPADENHVIFSIATDLGSDRVAEITATLGESSDTAVLAVEDTVEPETTITGIDVRHQRRSATVAFTSSEAGGTFRCRLDGGTFKSCVAPKTYQRLSVGRHTVRVKATDAAGNVDPTPAMTQFRIRR